jgi:predicted metal-dependent hydrolase
VRALPWLSLLSGRASQPGANPMAVLPAEPDVLACQCRRPPPPDLIRGLAQFNAGQFWECHETLEDIWRREPGPVRDLYRGILQVGVGFLHLRRGNFRGAVSLLRRGLERLERLPPACQGVDVADLRHRARWCLERLAELGPARIGEFRPEWVPRVRFAGPEPTPP